MHSVPWPTVYRIAAIVAITVYSITALETSNGPEPRLVLFGLVLLGAPEVIDKLPFGPRKPRG